MYQNRDNLVIGNDYYNLKTGEYAFTYIYDGCERVDVEGIVESFTKSYGTTEYEVDVYAYVKGTSKLIDEDDLCDLCYNDVYVTKQRLDQLADSKAKIQAIIDEAKIKEPFVFEDGKLSVGKEHVLSAHIQAGFDQGWISSSICW